MNSTPYQRGGLRRALNLHEPQCVLPEDGGFRPGLLLNQGIITRPCQWLLWSGGCPQRPSMWVLFILPDTREEGHQIDPPRATTGSRNKNQASSPVLSLPLGSSCLQGSSLAWCQGPTALFPEAGPGPALCYVPAGLCDTVKPQLPPVIRSHVANKGPQAGKR